MWNHQPLESIGSICKAHNLQFIVDAAQTAGVIPIDVKVVILMHFALRVIKDYWDLKVLVALY